ncbi:MAG: ATP-binding protein [Candidatus Njordarchaeales archaeon]
MKVLGKVVSGSVDSGVKIILENSENIENYPLGSLVTINGINHKYLGIITDAGLSSTDKTAYEIINPNTSPRIKENLLKVCSDLLRTQWVEIALIAQASNDGTEPMSADTMPSFASALVETNVEEISAFFGKENERNLWSLGQPKTPKTLLVEVPIDVEKLANLSFGIFGKSGTGKTFLGNLLAGYITLYDLIARGDKPYRLLIFDMHSEYALELKDNLGRPIADGVAKIFSNYYVRYTLDPELAEKRNLRLFKINLSQLTPDDIRLIGPIFGVSETFLTLLGEYRKLIDELFGLGKYWLWILLMDEETEERFSRSPEGQEIIERLLEFIQERKGLQSVTSIARLRRSFEKAVKEKLGFSALQSFISQAPKLRKILSYPVTITEDHVGEIVNYLTEKDGAHVTISLGKYEKELPLYMLVANLIARRLRDMINKKILEKGEPDTKIIIFLEEAHNFLGRTTYRLSPFGDIAREMRKRGVILCVIDQRPSELDSDVISMLWTNFVFSLTEKSDIEAALMGAPQVKLFKKLIPLLRNREVLVYGEAIKFPIVISVKDYSEAAQRFIQIIKQHNKKIEERKKMFREAGLL